MLNDHELELWKRKLGINQAGSDLIDRIRNSDPARVTRGWVGGNVCGRYPSQKMGHTIQFESHKGELPFIVSRCEFPANDDVLEFWDQPTTLRMRYKNKDGRMITVNNTPDFFLMQVNAAGFIECKLEESLVQLAKDQPNKFVLSPDGTWRCPPGEEESAKFGLYYKIVSSAEIDRKVYRNTVFLEDFLRVNTPDVPEQARSSILKIVSAKEGLSLSTLLAMNSEIGGESDYIYQLIASGLLYVDLSAEALIDRDRVQVFSSKEISGPPTVPRLPRAEAIELKLGETINWGDDVFEIANLDHQNVWLIGSRDHYPKLSKKHLEQLIARGEVLQISQRRMDCHDLTWKKVMDEAKPTAVKEAHRRYEILMKYYRKEEPLNVPIRTVKRWASQYRQATVSPLRTAHPELCRQIRLRYDKHNQHLLLSKVQALIDKMLVETPPPSLRSALRTLVVSYHWLRKYLPDAHRSLLTRYLNFRREQTLLARTNEEVQIRTIVRELNANGIFPSMNAVLDVFTVKALKHPDVWSTIKAAREALPDAH